MAIVFILNIPPYGCGVLFICVWAYQGLEEINGMLHTFFFLPSLEQGGCLILTKVATGSTQTIKEQKEVSVKQYIEEYIMKSVEELVGGDQYLPAFLMITCGVEFLGKCIGPKPFKDRDHQGNNFKNALGGFSSLNKYIFGCSVDIYKNLRCGIVHSLLPDNNIMLVEENNNLPNVIGLKDLKDDFITACNDLLTDVCHMGGNKSLNDTICYIS